MHSKLSFSALVRLTLLMILSGMGLNTQLSATELRLESIKIDQRVVKIWHWMPDKEPLGTILFSHGAASSPAKYTPITDAWVAAGYEIVAPLHVDSTDHPNTSQYQGMASWVARMQDMQRLAELYGGDGYIAAGHSYGALTALVKGGASGLLTPELTAPLSDAKVSLVLAFSPPSEIPGFISKQDYATLNVPALIQTGTMDTLAGSEVSWEGHLDAYHAAQAGGDRYALVLDDVDHYFGGLICRLDLPGPPQTAQLDQAVKLSITMLKAYAQADQMAEKMLQQQVGNHPRFTFYSK